MSKVKCSCSLLWSWDQSLPFVTDAQKVSACNFYYIPDMTIIVVRTVNTKVEDNKLPFPQDICKLNHYNPSEEHNLKHLYYNISILVEPYPSMSKNSQRLHSCVFLDNGQECFVLISHIWSFVLSGLSLDLWGLHYLLYFNKEGSIPCANEGTKANIKAFTLNISKILKALSCFLGSLQSFTL